LLARSWQALSAASFKTPLESSEYEWHKRVAKIKKGYCVLEKLKKKLSILTFLLVI
jgi:hypothetical protein